MNKETNPQGVANVFLMNHICVTYVICGTDVPKLVSWWFLFLAKMGSYFLKIDSHLAETRPYVAKKSFPKCTSLDIKKQIPTLKNKICSHWFGILFVICLVNVAHKFDRWSTIFLTYVAHMLDICLIQICKRTFENLKNASSQKCIICFPCVWGMFSFRLGYLKMSCHCT